MDAHILGSDLIRPRYQQGTATVLDMAAALPLPTLLGNRVLD